MAGFNQTVLHLAVDIGVRVGGKKTPEHDGPGGQVLRNRQDVWDVLEGGGVVVDVRYGNNDGNGSPTARSHRSARDLKDNC